MDLVARSGSACSNGVARRVTRLCISIYSDLQNGAMTMNSLWLAIYLPGLPLEAGSLPSSPSAVVEQGRILVCDDAARRAGVNTGIGVAAARALVPAITLVKRDAAREAAVLHALACWAGGFTPRVTLTSCALLLEVGACLRLFGGLEKLLAVVTEGVRTQGFTAHIAVAMTPLGALWLAESGIATVCLDQSTLRQQLDALSISVLPGKAAELLARFGVATLADARNLPSAVLARRIGTEVVNLMARAFGNMSDLRPDFVFPDQFQLSLVLPAPVETAAALLFAARRLTSALTGWLAARQAGLRELALRLLHRQGDTLVSLQFADLTRDGERIERVLRERIERIALKAPVEALRLEAVSVISLPGRSAAMFDDADAARDAMNTLLERLRARLGDGQVYRLTAHADHRPECATRHVAITEKIDSSEPASFQRPFLLLDQPESLPEVDGRPHCRGPLKLMAGPERIESGWWDGGEATGDVRRDYFVACSADTRWLWIYRECRAPGGWFLQGFFA